MAFFKFNNKNKNDPKNINKPEYRIIVKKYIAKNIPQIIADFTAVQDKTSAMNLVIKNIDYDFKEDISIQQSKIISDLEYKLNLLKYNNEKQIEIITEKITNIEETIKSVEKGYINKDTEKEEKVNINDLKYDLRNFKVLKYCIENKGDGSYIEIDQNGMKTISYLYDDGILKPIFHVSKDESISSHPNEGAVRKRFFSEQYLIDKEFQEDTNGLLGSKLDKLLKFAVVIILALEIFAGVQLMGAYNDYGEFKDSNFVAQLNNKAQGSAIECAYYYSEIIKSNGEAIKYINNEIMNKTNINNHNNNNKEDNPIVGLSNKLLNMN